MNPENLCKILLEIVLFPSLVFGRKSNNYYDKGAGYFKIAFKNFEIEILGQRGNLSLNQTIIDVKSIPTKIQISKDLWVRSHANPGLYVRGRYGHSILKHVQSWRSIPSRMNKNGDMSYSLAGQGGWMDCEKPGHHSCLDLHDIDGNLDLLPNIYPPSN